MTRPKLEGRRQTLLHLGLDRRKAVRRRAPNGIGLTLGAHNGGGHRSASCGPGNSSEFRVLVSNVGCRDRREASFLRNQGEPRGEPRGRRIDRVGGSSWQGGQARLDR